MSADPSNLPWPWELSRWHPRLGIHRLALCQTTRAYGGNNEKHRACCHRHDCYCPVMRAAIRDAVFALSAAVTLCAARPRRRCRMCAGAAGRGPPGRAGVSGRLLRRRDGHRGGAARHPGRRGAPRVLGRSSRRRLSRGATEGPDHSPQSTLILKLSPSLLPSRADATLGPALILSLTPRIQVTCCVLHTGERWSWSAMQGPEIHSPDRTSPTDPHRREFMHALVLQRRFVQLLSSFEGQQRWIDLIPH